MPTPHIRAQPGDFADAVLMPGDPLRAEHIATHYLDDARRVTDVRNMYGFTGNFRGQPDDRQTSFDRMIRIALDTAIAGRAEAA